MSYLSYADAHDIVRDETHALMDKATFDRLDEYSSSMPTAPSVGRVWKRRVPWQTSRPLVCWQLGEVVDRDETFVYFAWRTILVAEA